MSDKYIIRNCPIFETDYYCGENLDKCATCTDCLLKRIVELCFKARQECNCSDIIPEVDCADCTEGGMNQLASEILDLLEIEECEND